MSWLAWLGLSNVSVTRDDVLRLLVLAGVCLALGFVIVDYGGGTTEQLEVGDVAPRTVKAPRSFTHQDEAEWQSRQEAAGDAVLPVYVHQADLLEDQVDALGRAFGDAREDLLGALADAAEDAPDGVAAPAVDFSVDDLTPEVFEGVRTTFRRRLPVKVSDRDIDALLRAGFPDEARSVSVALLDDGMGRLIVGDRGDLPGSRTPMTVVDVSADGNTERVVRDYQVIAIPEEVRRDIELRGQMLGNDARWVGAAVRLAQTLVGPNLAPREDMTLARRAAAAADVPPVEVYVKRGTVLFRDGEALTAAQISRYRALQATSGPAVWLEIVSVVFFLALLVFSLVHFGINNLRQFSMRVRDVTAVSLLLLLVAVLARIVVGLSDTASNLIGYDCEPGSVWFLVPVAAASILVRLLVGVNWAVVTGLVAAAICGLLMDLSALMVLYAFLSSVIAAGAVDNTRERLSIFRAGLVTGIANAAVALLVHFLGFFMGEGEIISAVTLRPAWSMLFALGGGLLSAILVLGLMPLFERAGFVTDYRLMELANLNHPLMRQLMLRAPGSYHHSVVVGSLSEAACEEIGANALQTRVAAYFHDIGKSLKPQYFVENQGSGGNKHEGLDPYTSAAIIISHVTEGGELARKYRLPKPCIDNIYMHHGTGLLQYFYAKAVEEAGGDESKVDELAFRYPGPRPDSKEAGVLMLADKVEAATRTIQEPTEEKFRSMIHAIINSVMADNQFEDCPLTFQELYAITDAFVGVLNGIHHQRIEYPQTSHLSAASRKDVPPAPRKSGNAVITLEIPTQEQRRAPSPVPASERAEMSPERAEMSPDPDTDESTLGDYEAVEHLPGSGGT